MMEGREGGTGLREARRIYTGRRDPHNKQGHGFNVLL